MNQKYNEIYNSKSAEILTQVFTANDYPQKFHPWVSSRTSTTSPSCWSHSRSAWGAAKPSNLGCKRMWCHVAISFHSSQKEIIVSSWWETCCGPFGTLILKHNHLYSSWWNILFFKSNQVNQNYDWLHGSSRKKLHIDTPDPNQDSPATPPAPWSLLPYYEAWQISWESAIAERDRDGWFWQRKADNNTETKSRLGWVVVVVALNALKNCWIIDWYVLIH